jgi:hypothetical protein
LPIADLGLRIPQLGINPNSAIRNPQSTINPRSAIRDPQYTARYDFLSSRP